MELAKPRFDVGLAVRDLSAQLEFWQNTIGLPFDHMLPLGGGVRQHRHELLGSVLKINHARDGVPETPPTGYRALMIAREGLGAPQKLTDPEGNEVILVPSGWRGVTRIGMITAVRDVAAQRHFYGEVLGLPQSADADSFLCGDSVLCIDEDSTSSDDVTMDGAGWRYLTIQVPNCNRAHQLVLTRGGREGRPPITLGDVARFSFVRDAGGNWIELSQRKSLTGTLEP